MLSPSKRTCAFLNAKTNTGPGCTRPQVDGATRRWSPGRPARAAPLCVPPASRGHHRRPRTEDKPCFLTGGGFPYLFLKRLCIACAIERIPLASVDKIGLTLELLGLLPLALAPHAASLPRETRGDFRACMEEHGRGYRRGEVGGGGGAGRDATRVVGGLTPMILIIDCLPCCWGTAQQRGG